MEPLPAILLLKLVSLLASSSSALQCYSCAFVENDVQGILCAFGGNNTNLSIIDKPAEGRADMGFARQGGTGEKNETCATFYGVLPKNVLYTVIRTNILYENPVEGCQEWPEPPSKLCLCNTDLCNYKVPPGILKCHLCAHTEIEPNQGCVSATNTIPTLGRNSGKSTEQDALVSKITATGLVLRETSDSAGRQSAYEPHKYQKCFFFEGTQNGVQTLVRTKAYVPQAYIEGCRSSSKPINGLQGRVCYCSTDLCNSKPGGTSCTKVHFLTFYAFVMGLTLVSVI